MRMRHRFTHTAVFTLGLFVMSLFSPMIQVYAAGSNFYDGPGGYQETLRYKEQIQYTERSMEHRIGLHNQKMNDTNKVIGMALGGAVGGGLVLALGLAASPVLAITAVVGSIIAGGFIGDKFGTSARNTAGRAGSNNNFMSWAGGLAGGALGFMLPGGSVVGAALGAGIGGAAGNYFADSQNRFSDRSSQMFMGGMERMGGMGMGPMGSMAGVPNVQMGLMNAHGMGNMNMGWYGQDGGFMANGRSDGLAYDPYTGLSDYVWHDNNGDLAYPGLQNDLYRLDNSSRLTRTAPQWTMGGEGNYSDRNHTYSSSYSSGGSIENPGWGMGSSSGYSSDGDVYSTYVTTDGETFNPNFEEGSNYSVLDLQRRYQAAVQELSDLTRMNAPERQRREAHQEVQRLERLLAQKLGR